MIPFLLLSAFLWGVCVALFMQYTRLGLFISLHLMLFSFSPISFNFAHR